MGYSKLTYDTYIQNIGYWLSKGILAPAWAQELYLKGYKPVCAIDFYYDVFGEDLEPHRLPEDYKTGEYAAIALEVQDIVKIDKDGKEKKQRSGRRITVTRELMELYDLIDKSENFCMIAPVSYAGKRRINQNARYLYALTMEIDSIEPKNGLDELIYSWQRKNLTTPQPTYIVCSGTGLHLYFVFERPIPLFANIFQQLSKVKEYFTPFFWSEYITKSWQKPQFEPLTQPFRCVGTRTKAGAYAMAFETGKKITLEYLNNLLPKDLQVNQIYKSKLSKARARELYPDWYRRRVEEGQPRGNWTRHEPIYYNWIKKIKSGAAVGHRYNCLENLCSLAVQCNIPPEQVEKDCSDLAEYFESLTVSEDNHFTEYDVICALKTYYEASETAYRRKIEYISKKTGIELKPNKRNGRKQNVHIKIMTSTRDILYPDGSWRDGNGRRSKEQLVQDYLVAHPDVSVTQAARDLGVSRPTIYKYMK